MSSTSNLVSKFLTSVGRACNFILDLAPNNTGLLLPDGVASYQAFGEATRAMLDIGENSSTLIANIEGPFVGTQIIIPLNSAKTPFHLGFGAVQLWEDIRNGQRISKHLIEINLEGGDDDKWVNLTDKSQSLTIGHRRIQTYNVTSLGYTTSQMRVTVLEFVGEQNESLVGWKGIQLFDWALLASSEEFKTLDWDVIVSAGA